MAQISIAIESIVDERKKNASNYPLGWKRILAGLLQPLVGSSSVHSLQQHQLASSNQQWWAASRARILFLRLKPLITIKEGFAPRNAITMPFYSAAMMMIGLVA